MPTNLAKRLSKRGTLFVRKDKEDKIGHGPDPTYCVCQWWLNTDTMRLYAKPLYHYATRREAEQIAFELTEKFIDNGCLKRLPNGKVVNRWDN